MVVRIHATSHPIRKLRPTKPGEGADAQDHRKSTHTSSKHHYEPFLFGHDLLYQKTVPEPLLEVNGSRHELAHGDETDCGDDWDPRLDHGTESLGMAV